GDQDRGRPAGTCRSACSCPCGLRVKGSGVKSTGNLKHQTHIGNREMANLQQLVDELSKLTVLEAAELSKLLEEKWGVSAAAPVAMAAAPGAAAAAAAAAEKTEFTVVLASA